jgi:hypothetical protein
LDAEAGVSACAWAKKIERPFWDAVLKVRLLKFSGPIPRSSAGGAPARAGALGSTSREEIAMYRALFARDLFAELDRLQREVQEAFDLSPSIRGFGRGGFPALNVGGTPQSVEIYAFAPGLDPATMEVNLDRGLLTIAGERTPGPTFRGR